MQTRNTLPLVLGAVLGMLAVAPAKAQNLPGSLPDATGADMSKPVQVYIMMGQSNMLGYGRINGGTNGYLDYAVDTKGLYPYLKSGGAWTQRDDVRYTRVQGSGGQSGSGVGNLLNNNWLNVGNETDNTVGVEYGVGHALGDAVDAPVLLLKSAIGNRALGWDLLPPGGVQYDHTDGYTYPGSGGSPERWVTGSTPEPISWYAGLQYEGDVQRAHNVLANIGTYYPGATDYEVAGFLWWQGDRDRYKDGHADKYEENLVRLIGALRTEFDAPDAPFVLATLGQTDINDGPSNDKTILDAMFAVDGDAGNYPQFAGNVSTVYSHPLSLGGASNSHYNNNAETYMNVGEAMGQAMVDLISIGIPGDTDGDGDIDTLDLTTAITNFTGPDGTGKTAADGDTDGDGDVDTVDLTLAITNFTGALPSEPTLIYHSATGNVSIHTNGTDIISFNLKGGPFSPADFSDFPAGLTDNIPTDIGWTSFDLFSGLIGSADLGPILPAGLSLAQVEAALATRNYGLTLAGGGGGAQFDITMNPEPTTLALLGVGGLCLLRRRRRRVG